MEAQSWYGLLNPNLTQVKNFRELQQFEQSLSSRQVEDASEIASIAQQAYEISSDAYEMARQALEQQHYTANQIRVLEVQVTDMGEKLRTVQSLAGQTLRDSTDAYNQALNIYQQVMDAGFEVIKTENLYTFDGVAGFSAGQGQ